jgi:hypothetical protein
MEKAGFYLQVASLPVRKPEYNSGPTRHRQWETETDPPRPPAFES